MRAAGYKAVVHAKIIIASKITQPSSPASLLVTGLERLWQQSCRRVPSSAVLFVLSVC
jgi:hypothetical protein